MNNKKILVIDDNPGIVRLDESLLKSQGYEVISASDGALGLKLAQEEKPDIVFLDIILPEMHGFEVCKRIKENPETQNIPVIIVTASGLQDVIEDEPDIKADGYVSKPYGLDDLINVIRKIEEAGSS